MPKDSQNTFLPLLPLAMHAPKPKARKPRTHKPKTRKTFWSQNSHEIDRIGAKGIYTFSDSSNDTEDASSSSGHETSASSQETSSQGTSNTDSETDIAKCNGNYCFVRDILKRPLDSYEPGSDLKGQILEEFNDWLDGGFHRCSATAYSSAPPASTPIDSGNDNDEEKVVSENNKDNDEGDENVNNDKLTLTQQERDDYYHSVSRDDYWKDVHWAGDREAPGSEDHHISHG